MVTITTKKIQEVEKDNNKIDGKDIKENLIKNEDI